MKKIIVIILSLTILAFISHFYYHRISFSYKHLDKQKTRVIDELKFTQDKNNLAKKINSPLRGLVGEFTQIYRDNLQAGRCARFLNIYDDKKQPIINHRKFVQTNSINDSYIFKKFSLIQKTVGNNYLLLCLKLINDGETYRQMLDRYSETYKDIVNKTQDDNELKKLYNLNMLVGLDKKPDYAQIKKAKEKIKLPTTTNKEKSKLYRLIRKSKRIIKEKNVSYQDDFLRLVKESSSPDVIHSILYNYENQLPKYWKEGLVQAVTGLDSKELNYLPKNEYIESLIYPSIDLYLCSIGFPCDENSYLMYFQCMGLKYQANEEACNQPVYSYYFSSFLTVNMQHDVIKIINYIEGSLK